MGSAAGGAQCAQLAKAGDRTRVCTRTRGAFAPFRQVLEDKMASGKIGQQLMDEAERRGARQHFTILDLPMVSRGPCIDSEGMNGRERLRKTLFELSFAGFGGDGPGGQFLWCSLPNRSWVVLTLL